MASAGEGASPGAAPPPPARAADGLAGIVPIAAAAILVVNDHWLKASWPGFVSGKLSDVAGLVLAPLVLLAGWELARWAAGWWTGPSRVALAVSIVTVGIGFAVVKAYAPATEVWRTGLGVAQWPFAAMGALLAGAAPPAPRPVAATVDPGDLLALPALAVSWWVGARRVVRPGRATGEAPRAPR